MISDSLVLCNRIICQFTNVSLDRFELVIVAFEFADLRVIGIDCQ